MNLSSALGLSVFGMDSDTQRALVPLVLLGGYVLLSAVAYGIRVLMFGPYRDEELAKRGSSAMLSMEVRHYFAWMTRPFWFVLRRSGLPPFAVTVLSFLLAAGAGIAIASGRVSIGGWMYLLAGLFDFFDGRLARSQGVASKAGAALDSVLDRWADGILFIGLAWFYREHNALILALVGLLATQLVSYTRARGEGLGVEVKVGVMQRPERVVYLGLSLALCPLVDSIPPPAGILPPPHRLAVLGMFLVGVTSIITAIQRLVYLLRVLSRGDDQSPRPKHPEGTLRGHLAKNLVASFIATAGDFLLVMVLVSRYDWNPAVATTVGCVLGGFINFAVNRNWTFRVKGARLSQASRYVVTSASSAVLNASGVALLMAFDGIDYRAVWLLVRVSVFLIWNFPLMRSYVFAPERVSMGPSAERALPPHAEPEAVRSPGDTASTAS